MRLNFTRLWAIALILIVLSISILGQQAIAGPVSEPENAASTRGSIAPATGNLTYHGGPVLTSTQTVYLIYWQPSGYSYSTRYRSLIDGYIKNVELDAGKTTNVLYSAIQYKDGSNQNASSNVVFGGSVVDTSPFPANGCTNPTTTVCLNDTQIRAKLTTVLANQFWQGGYNKIYFLMLPKNVGSCYDGTNTFCSFQDYCGYHAREGDLNAPILYSLISYAMTVPSKCGSYSHPNGDDADSSINIIAHEHGELITDPLHTAWYNSDKRERSDKCFWQFGQHLGWTAYGKYNQQIGTGKYYLQSQWSNQAGACVLSGL